MAAKAGYYQPVGSQTPIEDPAGTYSAAGATSPTPDPAGYYSAAGASAPTLIPAGSYSPNAATTPIKDSPGYYSAAGASAQTEDPAGTYSAAGAASPTTDPAGTYSAAGAAAPTLAGPGYFVAAAGAGEETAAPAGFYDPGYGNTAAFPDPVLTVTEDPILSSADTAVGFTVTGLVENVTGVVAFADGSGDIVNVSVAAGQTQYTANFGSLAAGKITSTLTLDPKVYKGGKFSVIARHNSPQNLFIQSATLNGKPLSRTWITHEQIVAGGTLVLEMGAAPNRAWGAAAADRP